MLLQRRLRDAPYISLSWKFSRVPDYAHGYFSLHFNGLLSLAILAILWMWVQNLKLLALPVPGLIGGIQKIGQFLDTPTPPCLQIFMAFCSDWACEYPVKFEVHSFKRSWDNWRHRINLGSPCIRPRSVLSIIFNRLLFAFGLRRAKGVGLIVRAISFQHFQPMCSWILMRQPYRQAGRRLVRSLLTICDIKTSVFPCIHGPMSTISK